MQRMRVRVEVGREGQIEGEWKEREKGRVWMQLPLCALTTRCPTVTWGGTCPA